MDLRDNGSGFKKNGRHGGFGLTGMRERVEQIGGTLTITSARGKGTKIVVVLPDKQTAPDLTPGAGLVRKDEDGLVRKRRK